MYFTGERVQEMTASAWMGLKNDRMTAGARPQEIYLDGRSRSPQTSESAQEKDDAGRCLAESLFYGSLLTSQELLCRGQTQI